MTSPDPTKIYLSPVEKDNIKQNSTTRQLIEVASANATSVSSLSSTISGLSSTVRIKLTADTTFNVTTAGNDSTGDGSVATPWATIQKAIDACYSLDFNGRIVTINIGSGTFDPFTAFGPFTGFSGTSSGNANILFLVGAGSGLTSINAGSKMRYSAIGSSGINFLVTAAAPALSMDNDATMVFNADISFTGNDASATAINNNEFSKIVNNTDITIAGTLGTYFLGFNTAWYEDNGNITTITGTVGTLIALDLLSNFHSYSGATFAFSGGGSISGATYTISRNSYFAADQSLTLIAPPGQIAAGGRSDGACVDPTVSATGIGTGSAALTDGNTLGCRILLSPTGAPSSSGTITVQFSEIPFATSDFDHFSSFVVSLVDGSGTWVATATAKISSYSLVGSLTAIGGKMQIVIAWNNPATNLTAGQTYAVNLIGQT